MDDRVALLAAEEADLVSKLRLAKMQLRAALKEQRELVGLRERKRICEQKHRAKLKTLPALEAEVLGLRAQLQKRQLFAHALRGGDEPARERTPEGLSREERDKFVSADLRRFKRARFAWLAKERDRMTRVQQ